MAFDTDLNTTIVLYISFHVDIIFFSFKLDWDRNQNISYFFLTASKKGSLQSWSLRQFFFFCKAVGLKIWGSEDKS